jgi:mannose-6-phosphate isomerase-like protein (cupin superfamily)
MCFIFGTKYPMVSTISFQQEVQKLPLPATGKWPNGVFDVECFKHGSMSIVLYTPRIHDYQTPHEQDEIYIVYKGTGQLKTENGTFAFVAGDVLFVSAGAAHQFEDFSDDLALWVVFWGPKGGER